MESISSRKNPRIYELKELVSSAAKRKSQKCFVCEGHKLLKEAAAKNWHIRSIVAEKGTDLTGLPHADELIVVPRELLEYISSQKNPDSLLFTCDYPYCTEAFDEEKSIVLENVQDPGNVGTVIRTASAFGVKRVILLGDCADPFGPKAVRASMGAIFRIGIGFADYAQCEDFAVSHTFAAAALSDDCVDLRTIESGNLIPVIGSEGHGLSDRMLGLCKKKIIIPMMPDCESLNAAAAATIILWELYGRNLP